MSENKSRKPRFKRVPNAPNFRLTSRDIELIRHVKRYRFLRSTHLADLTGGSHQVISRRLNLLFHHGYLDRPPEQLALTRLHGNLPIVYGIKGRRGGNLFLEHTLAVADFMVALECACAKQPRVRFIDQAEIISLTPSLAKRNPNPLYWSVTIYGREKKHVLGVIPDRIFGIEIKSENGSSKTGFFFLEVDRNTMPITRQSFNQTSILRKLLAYLETWKQKIHQRQLGIRRFRVVIVTTELRRAEHIVSESQKQVPGNRVFLVIDISKLKSGNSILDLWFQTTSDAYEQLTEKI